MLPFGLEPMNDTHPAIAAMILDGYRRMTPAEKLARCADLSTSVRQLAAARIRAENPGLTEREVLWRVAALLYPPELLERAARWEAERRR
jgi:hypothetical protein